jgi:hypothetical protein
MYMAVIKAASAITTAVTAIASGDQNPLLLTVTGVFVGLNPMGVPMGAADGVGDAAWVMVNVVVATPPVDPVAVTVYVPGGNCGTVSMRLIESRSIFGVNVATVTVPKVTLTEGANCSPCIEDITNMPAGP